MPTLENFMEIPAKVIKDVKDSQEIKKRSLRSDLQWDWKPLATDLGITIAKGLLTGFALRLGGQMYDYSFNRRTSNTSLALLDGGKKSQAA